MNLLPNKSLSFTWPEKDGVLQYKIYIYVNDYIRKNIIVSSNSYVVEGLYEGDTVYLDVFAHQNGISATTAFHITEEQSVPVYNFKDEGKFLSFASFYESNNFLSLDSSLQNQLITYNHKTPSLFFSFKIISPRNNNIISTFQDEPFLESISYSFKAGNSILSSGTVDSFDVSFTNTFKEENITAEFIINDVYGESSKLIVDLVPEKAKVEKTLLTDILIEASGSSFEVVPTYNLENIDYSTFIVSSGVNFETEIATGISYNLDSFNLSLPVNSSYQLKILPHNWLGPGEEYIKPDTINHTYFPKIPNISGNNLTFFGATRRDSQYIDIEINRTNYNTIGSYVLLSVDAAPETSFTSGSYFTGAFDSVEEFYSFDYFYSRTGAHENLYCSARLLRSGTNQLEGQETRIVEIPLPKITSRNFLFNYVDGTHELNLTFEPSPKFDGVDFNYYTNYDPTLIYYTGQELVGTGLNPSYYFSVKKSFNQQSLANYTISSQAQNVGVSLSPTNFVSMDTTVDVVINAINSPQNISRVDVYRKPAFEIIDGDVGPKLNEILEFNDYKNYFYESTALGHYPDDMPADIGRKEIYQIEGDGFTGSYASGTYYLYKMVPVNGFGDGISDQSVLEFTPNLLSQINVDKQIQTESNVVNLDINKVDIKKDQIIEGSNTFLKNITLSGVEPTDDSHIVNKSYVDSVAGGDLIRKTFSSFYSGIEIISGNSIFLTNILHPGNIIINDQSVFYDQQALFYPIECNKIQGEKVGQFSYYLSDPFTGQFIVP